MKLSTEENCKEPQGMSFSALTSPNSIIERNNTYYLYDITFPDIPSFTRFPHIGPIAVWGIVLGSYDWWGQTHICQAYTVAVDRFGYEGVHIIAKIMLIPQTVLALRLLTVLLERGYGFSLDPSIMRSLILVAIYCIWWDLPLTQPSHTHP